MFHSIAVDMQRRNWPPVVLLAWQDETCGSLLCHFFQRQYFCAMNFCLLNLDPTGGVDGRKTLRFSLLLIFVYIETASSDSIMENKYLGQVT
jgi:hypothetical protein